MNFNCRLAVIVVLASQVLPASINGHALPAAPTTVMVSPGDAQVTVSWEPAPGSARYHVKRGPSLTGPLSVIATNVAATAFTDAGVRNGATYFYAVSGATDEAESSDSLRLRAAPSAPVLDLLPAGAKVERLVQGYQFLEGPVWIPEPNGYLVFSDIPASLLLQWTPAQGASIFRRSSGQANGNTIDLEGRLLTCEHANRRITRLERDGTLTPLVTEYAGKRFNAPNDAVVKSDGTVWFTDPNYGLGQVQPGRFVYRFHPSNGNGTVTLVAQGFDQPNGLCFSPDETKLYVADSGGPHHVRVFDVRPDNTLTNSRIFAVISAGVPDGMRTDASGRVFVTAADGVHVFSPEGQLLGRIRTPETAANVSFGGRNREMIFITANTSVYGITHRPDLIVSSVHRFPTTAVVGQPVRFMVTVKNQGTGPAASARAIHVGLTINGQTNVLRSGHFTAPIPPDASVTLLCDQGGSHGAWLAAEGVNALTVTVDGPDHFSESNERNNTLTAPFSAAPASFDSDQDGLSDADEIIAGTDASQKDSVLKIMALTRPDPQSFAIAWSSVPGKKYRVAAKDRVAGLEWIDLSGDLVAADTTLSWTNRFAAPAESHRLWRVRVVP